MSDPPPGFSEPPVGQAAFASTDWRPKAIAIMTTAGGGIAILLALINIFAALFVCVTLLTAAYSGVVGALCLIKGIPMLSKPPATVAPPYATAIMQIINIIACDPINLTLGIVILVLLNDPEVRTQFQNA